MVLYRLFPRTCIRFGVVHDCYFIFFIWCQVVTTLIRASDRVQEKNFDQNELPLFPNPG